MSNSDNRGLGATTLLAWIATCGGPITNDQHKLLRDFAGAQRGSDTLDVALGVVRGIESGDLLLACETVRSMSQQARRTFFHWAFTIAKSKQRFDTLTNYVLRFLADVADENLDEFCRRTKSELPFPSDLSSIDWWNRIEGKSQPDSGQESQKKRRPLRGRLTVEEAHAILSTTSDASQEDLAKEFRRLASLHHPDRFVQAGPEAQVKAAREFARIRMAFETLSRK